MSTLAKGRLVQLLAIRSIRTTYIGYTMRILAHLRRSTFGAPTCIRRTTSDDRGRLSSGMASVARSF